VRTHVTDIPVWFCVPWQNLEDSGKRARVLSLNSLGTISSGVNIVAFAAPAEVGTCVAEC
jgi:hypothetical protein